MVIIIRRFFELITSCALLSSVITFLYRLGLFSTYGALNIAIATCVLIFILYNIYAMYNCYLFLISRWRFYFLNYTAYMLFSAVTYISLYFLEHKIYIWFFGITKFIYFGGIKAFWIITVFHIVMLVVISILPVGVHCITMYREERQWITDVFDENN